MPDLHAPILVVGGGLGGVAAALAALEAGQRVILTEEFAWLGGQSTSQAVPFDEHPWVEDFGVTARYRRLRDGVRQYYRDHYPLTDRARAWTELNPGAGWVSKLCHEPRVALAVIEDMLAPWRTNGALVVLQPARPVSATTDGDRVTSVTFDLLDDGSQVTVTADYVIEATETGELLALTGTEYAIGSEASSEFDEPSAPDVARPDNHQAVSICFAVDHVDGDHTIDKPAMYDLWASHQPEFWGAPLLSWTGPEPRTLNVSTRHFEPNPGDDALAVRADQSVTPGDGNLWTFRRILARDLFTPGSFDSDITLVNWPQIDYFTHPIIDAADGEKRLEEARQLSLSFLYWMQTEAPRPDGGTGWPGLRIRPDVVGTDDGLAMAPYWREARRIKAVTTVSEKDVWMRHPDDRARSFADSIGVGMYRIDLHPSTGGDNYIDVPASPFQLPLGFLIPRRVTNLLATAKTVGTTHITNGCYRLHPVEWNTGEAAGALAAHCLAYGLTPHQVHESTALTEDFQQTLIQQGVEVAWPDHVRGY
ncbi:FAD-dependent oxidoreductase [Parenemella sanctibonifatiensis]|uniref:FAD-dependent oxidoreductase n=1 Tax=Parenemella sanctibonifatiensis TaxID=2016505 RepID=A0A255ELH4_9ACTN|nr:FAD-dependent oxidoreductase [Parenemella sanctibonifatiensis]OYN92377.1 FAD-dependent oxidoreductase [Parenemella sanctibonifatiensis]